MKILNIDDWFAKEGELVYWTIFEQSSAWIKKLLEDELETARYKLDKWQEGDEFWTKYGDEVSFRAHLAVIEQASKLARETMEQRQKIDAPMEQHARWQVELRLEIERLVGHSSWPNSFEECLKQMKNKMYTDYRGEIQAQLPMPRNVAVAIIKDALRPGQPTLGLWFGWNQPRKTDKVKLGSVYGYIRKDEWLTLRKLLGGTEIGYNAAKDIIKTATKLYNKKYGAYNGVNRPSKFPKDMGADLCELFNNDTMLSCEEVFVPFSRLSSDDQAAYRMHTLLINTMTDGHNWACEWGDYIAAQYAIARELDWELYYDSHDKLAEKLLEYGIKLPVWVEDGDYSLPKVEKETLNWMFDNDIAKRVFGDNVDWEDWHSAVTMLAWTIEWLQQEWANGNLSLSYDEKQPKVVKTFLKRLEEL